MTKTGTTNSRTSPTMVRRQLGRKLRQLREACGKTREDVAATRLLSRGKLQSIENGCTTVRPGDAYELGRLYGATPEVIEQLRRLAIATTQESWWKAYGEDLIKDFGIYVDLEAHASEIWAYEPDVIHGLLQTEDYALAVDRGSALHRSDALIRKHVKLRMLRQQTLRKREPRPVVHLVLGESALRLRVGDADVLARQRDRLHEVADEEGFDLRVLREDVGPHPGLVGGFTVMDFADPEDPSVTYEDSYLGARYHDQEVHVARYREVFQSFYNRAIPLKEYLP
jgi:DNA-binding XRE family transcriptional regulator